jgi:hypothetical protein
VIKAGYLLQVGATAPFLPTALDVRVVKKPGLDTRLAPVKEVKSGSHVFCSLDENIREAVFGGKYLQAICDLQGKFDGE